MNQLLSICIPTFNRKEYLIQALQAVIPQAKLFNIPIYISDNCSIDETEYVIQQLQQTEYNLIFYTKQQQNIGMDRNWFAVLEMSQSKYCWWLGDDDVILDGAIAKILNILEHDNNIDLMVLNTQFITPDGVTHTNSQLLNIAQDLYCTDYLVCFSDYWNVTYFGNVIINRLGILQQNYARFIGTFHAYSGAIWDYLLQSHKLNHVNNIIILANQCVLLRTGEKTWSDSYVEVFYQAIPRWSMLLLPEYSNVANVNLKQHYANILRNRRLMTMRLDNRLTINNYRDFMVGIPKRNYYHRIKIIIFSLMPKFIFKIIDKIYFSIVKPLKKYLMEESQ